VERAKGLLMRQRGLAEEEAYKLLRKAAMDQNQRIVDIARSVLAVAEMLKP
jgi:AmiR/NasT family two-component response regulator